MNPCLAQARNVGELVSWEFIFYQRQPVSWIKTLSGLTAWTWGRGQPRGGILWCAAAPWAHWPHSSDWLGNNMSVVEKLFISNPCLSVSFWRTKTKTKTSETAISSTIAYGALPCNRSCIEQFSRTAALDPGTALSERLLSHNRCKLLFFLYSVDYIFLISWHLFIVFTQDRAT